MESWDDVEVGGGSWEGGGAERYGRTGGAERYGRTGGAERYGRTGAPVVFVVFAAAVLAAAVLAVAVFARLPRPRPRDRGNSEFVATVRS